MKKKSCVLDNKLSHVNITFPPNRNVVEKYDKKFYNILINQ